MSATIKRAITFFIIKPPNMKKSYDDADEIVLFEISSARLQKVARKLPSL